MGLEGAARFWPAFAAYALAGAAMVVVARAMDRGAESALPAADRRMRQRWPGAASASTRVTARGRAALGPLRPRRPRRRPDRAELPGHLVHGGLRAVSRGGRRPVLRGQPADGGVLPGRGLAGRADRAHPDDGLHAHPGQPAAGGHDARALGRRGGRPLPGTRIRLLDGRADAPVVHDGHRRSGRAHRHGRPDERRAQCRRRAAGPLAGGCPRLAAAGPLGAAHRLRRPEDHLRRGALLRFPATPAPEEVRSTA